MVTPLSRTNKRKSIIIVKRELYPCKVKMAMFFHSMILQVHPGRLEITLRPNLCCGPKLPNHTDGDLLLTRFPYVNQYFPYMCAPSSYS